MIFDSFLNIVPKIKNIPLAGQSAHLKMVPPLRESLLKSNPIVANTEKKAGVMALFYPNAVNITTLVLILRKTYKGVHSAQVGFPGGKHEPTDKNLEQTALREMEEEIGVKANTVTILKALTKVYIPPSEFFVYPFVGITGRTPIFKKQDSEVDAIIEIPLSEFLAPSSIVESEVSASYQDKMQVPSFVLQNHIVWGATGMILSELKDVLLAARINQI